MSPLAKKQRGWGRSGLFFRDVQRIEKGVRVRGGPSRAAQRAVGVQSFFCKHLGQRTARALGTGGGRVARSVAGWTLMVTGGLALLGGAACSSGSGLAKEGGEGGGAASADAPRGPAGKVRFPVGGDYYWAASGPLSALSIRIFLAGQYADIYDGTTLVGRSSICSGRRSHRTPSGPFTVLEKIAEHVSNRYGDYVDENGSVVQPNIDALGTPAPPGSSFRGTKMPYFLRIVGGVGLHAGPLPGFPDSHGCIRFPETIAQRLFSAASVGTPVLIED